MQLGAGTIAPVVRLTPAMITSKKFTGAFNFLQIQCISYFLFLFFHSFLVTTFIQTACISLAYCHVPQKQACHLALSYLMFNLPLTKSSQQRKTARHCKILMKSVLSFLYCVTNNVIVLTYCTDKSLEQGSPMWCLRVLGRLQGPSRSPAGLF